MTASYIPDVLNCENCRRAYDESDARDFEKYCSARCEAEGRQAIAEYHDEEEQQQAYEDAQKHGDSLIP